ncbi:hypothetical protein SBA3_330010 [Candidatus Sulfopaludibacter sp. SbA3]|nr:hypothetical protein SBA3_330010 [Candidatus Sulfopaludibacter sp. SbA3]
MKLWNAGRPTPATAPFLGWKHPGPIEAVFMALTLSTRMTFLGWKHPGPIEARFLEGE